MAAMSVRQALDLGHSLARAGRLGEAESVYRRVPFVTLAGERRAVARAGLSILSNVGLPDLIARDAAQYVERNVQLARDPDRLAHRRASLRERLQRSPLMNEQQFTRDLESLYETAWERWRATAP